MNSQALLDEITADSAAHIAFLQSFVQAPSPNPPGDTREAAAVIRSYLASHGIATEVIAPQAHMPNVVADFTCGRDSTTSKGEPGDGNGGGEGRRRLVLNGHMDVFPAGDGRDWDRSPWSGDVVDGRLHGRGAVDMKAGTAAGVVAFAYLHRHRAHLGGGGLANSPSPSPSPASVALCAVSDEETGGRWGTRWLLDLHEHEHEHEHEHDLGSGAQAQAQAQAGVVVGPSTSGGSSSSSSSRWAGDVVLCAEPGGLGTVRFAEKGTLRLTFTVDVGPGAHGAYTHLSRSATRVAAALIGDLAAVEDIVPQLDPALRAYLEREDVRRAIDECMGEGAADIAMKCTLNIGTLHGGLKVNMIPGTCAFEADIRMPLGLAEDDVLAVVRGVLDRPAYRGAAAVEVQRAASNPAAACAHDHPMVGILARQAVRVGGGGGINNDSNSSGSGSGSSSGSGSNSGSGVRPPPLAIPSLGATDCKHYRYRGIPAYVFGVSPETMGARNESVSVEEFLVVTKTLALAGWEYLGGEM